MSDEVVMCERCGEHPAVGTLRFEMPSALGGMQLSFTHEICSECGSAVVRKMKAAVEADDDPNWRYTLTTARA